MLIPFDEFWTVLFPAVNWLPLTKNWGEISFKPPKVYIAAIPNIA